MAAMVPRTKYRTRPSSGHSEARRFVLWLQGLQGSLINLLAASSSASSSCQSRDACGVETCVSTWGEDKRQIPQTFLPHSPLPQLSTTCPALLFAADHSAAALWAPPAFSGYGFNGRAGSATGTSQGQSEQPKPQEAKGSL